MASRPMDQQTLILTTELGGTSGMNVRCDSLFLQLKTVDCSASKVWCGPMSLRRSAWALYLVPNRLRPNSIASVTSWGFRFCGHGLTLLLAPFSRNTILWFRGLTENFGHILKTLWMYTQRRLQMKFMNEWFNNPELKHTFSHTSYSLWIAVSSDQHLDPIKNGQVSFYGSIDAESPPELVKCSLMQHNTRFPGLCKTAHSTHYMGKCM